MGTTEVTKQEAGDGTGASRRTVVKGFAWSVPVIAAATAAPISSASGCGTNAGSFGTTTAGVYNQWIPACATRIRYIVRGGGGASPNRDSTLISAGAETTGELVLPGSWAGGFLKLVVGAGGESVQNGIAQGGIGFGRGGNGTDTTKNPGSAAWSSAGGGGSAILFGSALLVASGGGGGGPVSVTKRSPDGSVLLVEDIGLFEPHAASGFNFGRQNAAWPNGVGAGLKKPGNDVAGALVGPARGGENGGAAVSGTWTASVNDNFVFSAAFAGTNGGAVGSGLNGGGNGGTAAIAQNGYVLSGETAVLDVSPSAGGGGGGYTGGGGGGFAFFRENFSGHTERAVAATSGGGAGSSFIASKAAGITVTGTTDVFREATVGRAGHEGRVWVDWS